MSCARTSCCISRELASTVPKIGPMPCWITDAMKPKTEDRWTTAFFTYTESNAHTGVQLAPFRRVSL